MWRLKVWYNECSDSNWTECSSPLSSPSHLVRQINNTHSTLPEITNTSSVSHDVTTREQGLSPHEVTPTISQPCRGSVCVCMCMLVCVTVFPQGFNYTVCDTCYAGCFLPNSYPSPGCRYGVHAVIPYHSSPRGVWLSWSHWPVLTSFVFMWMVTC